MLYPKNKQLQMDPSDFKNPSSEYRGAPFWAWNGDIEEQEMLRQYEIFKKMGFGGAHMQRMCTTASPAALWIRWPPA